MKESKYYIVENCRPVPWRYDLDMGMSLPKLFDMSINTIIKRKRKLHDSYLSHTKACSLKSSSNMFV